MRRHHDRIVSDPEVMLGKPVVAGTRIPVELVLRKLSQGASVEELDGYPRLTREDVAAVLDYAADVIALEEVVEVGSAGAQR